jgi:hypothetical protein
VAITNGYCTRGDLTDQLRITDNIDDKIIDRAVTTASRLIDGRCGRRFYADTTATARYYTPRSSTFTIVDDISSLTGLIIKSDADVNGTWETTLTVGTDIQVGPSNALARNEPINTFRAIQQYFPMSTVERETLEVTAKWGWPAVPDAVAQATALLAARIFKRYDSPLGVAGFGDMGAITVRRLDPDVELLIAPFRLMTYA